MANVYIGPPRGREFGDEWERFLDQLWLAETGESGYGQRANRVAYDGTDAANVLSSADATNGIGAHLLSQNGTYQVEVRNSGLNITGAPTLNALTVGSIPYVGAGKVLSEKNSKLFFDATNDRVGIGTGSPAQTLHVVGNGQVSTFLGVGGAPDTTHALLVTGLGKVTSRVGIGGDPDATALLKVTGGAIVTGQATIQTGAAITGGNLTVGTGPKFSVDHGNGDVFGDRHATFNGSLSVDSATFNVDSVNNRVGILTASPAHILDIIGSAGTITLPSVTSTDNVVLRGNGNVGIAIFNSTTGSGRIAFGDTDAEARGIVQYNHTNDRMVFTAAAATMVTISSTGVLVGGAGAPTALMHLSGVSALRVDNSANWASTVGAAGGASALPATPLGYWIINLGGSSVKVPYYNT